MQLNSKWIGIIGIGVVAVLVLGAAALASGQPLVESGGWMGTAHYGSIGPMGGYGCHGGAAGGTAGGGWGMAAPGTGSFGVVWPLLVLGIVLGIGYLLLRSPDRGSDEALAALRVRYASGELSEEEFIARRDTLQG